MGPDLQMQNYEDIGKDSIRKQNYLCKPAEKRDLHSKRVPVLRARGVKEQKVLAKASTFTPSKQPAGRSLLEAHFRGVAPHPTKGTF